MTNLEFSNEFDVLYNNITSNQAPGLDEYEKSVFLTKAQDEIVKAYFNPKTNKVQEGFDGNEKRQIDFSTIMKSVPYENTKFRVIRAGSAIGGDSTPITSMGQLLQEINSSSGTIYMDTFNRIDTSSIVVEDADEGELVSSPTTESKIAKPFLDSFFDSRDNTKSVVLESDILMFVNEYVEVNRRGSTSRLTILPINYNEYSRLMSKPYKRPLKNQAWRLLDNSSGYRKAELVVGPTDSITKYVIRYVKRPRAIILDVLSDGTSLDGYVGADALGNPVTDVSKAVQGITCELDPILHHEILQRAVELAKAAYTGDLTSQVALGQTSQTNMGIVTQSR